MNGSLSRSLRPAIMTIMNQGTKKAAVLLSLGILLIFAGCAGRAPAVGPVPDQGGAIAGPDASETATEREELWYHLYIRLGEDRWKIGYASQMEERTDRLIRDVSTSRINATLMGQQMDMTIVSRVDLTPDGALLSFEERRREQNQEIVRRGVVEGNDLVLETRIGDRTTTERVRFEKAPHVARSAEVAFFATMPEIGANAVFETLSETGSTTTPLAMEVTGEVPCTSMGEPSTCLDVRERLLGVEARMLIDPQGRQVWAQVSGIMEMELDTRDRVLSTGFDPGKDLDLFLAFQVETSGEDMDPDLVSTARYRLGGTGVEDLDLEDHRQRYAAPYLTVTMEKPPGERQSPAADAGDLPAALLASTPLIQSDAPEIIELVKSIVGKNKDPVASLQRLNDWVFLSLDKTVNVTGTENALDVLESREGDCVSHAVLLVALCRAAGIRAKQISGLVYENGRFFYHSWIYAYAGRWYALDPTFGRFPASAAYIRLSDDMPGSDQSWIAVTGDLAVEVLEVDDSPSVTNQ